MHPAVEQVEHRLGILHRLEVIPLLVDQEALVDDAHAVVHVGQSLDPVVGGRDQVAHEIGHLGARPTHVELDLVPQQPEAGYRTTPLAASSTRQASTSAVGALVKEKSSPTASAISGAVRVPSHSSKTTAAVLLR